MAEYDCVVVGGGVVGCATARALAADHDVALLERDQIAAGATGKASGLLSLDMHYGHVRDAVEHATAFFESYDGHRNVRYTRRPRVLLARPEETAEAQEFASAMREKGFEALYLDGEALAERFPGVFDMDVFAGGVVFEEFGWVDPYTLTTALASDADDRGAEVRTGVEVEAVAVEDGAVTGVETEEGRLGADHVVAAAGWRTRELLAGALEVPVRPERYYTVNLETSRTFGDDYPMAESSDPWLYWRPAHNGDLHVGGGAVMLGPPGEEQDGVGADLVDAVAEHVPRRLQGLDDARVASEDRCPHGDAATPDRYPIIDSPSDAPDGLVVATGFSGYGVMAAPFAATLARSFVTGESAPFDARHFRLDRFDDRGGAFAQPPFSAFGFTTPATLQ